MGLETLKLRDFDGIGKNIYEAIAIIAKRARRINSKRVAEREEIEMENAELESEEPLEPIVSSEDDPGKVSSKALTEMLDGDLIYRYIEKMPTMDEDIFDEEEEKEEEETSK